MIKKVTGLLKSKKSVIENFSYLSIFQIFNISFPLLTMPYLLSVLGKETYGLVVFTQTFVSYFLVLVNFGFNLSATKEVSINRDDKNKLSEIVSSILIIKGVFFLLSFVIMYIILFFLKESNDFVILSFLTMYLCLYEWMFPVWYFQGIEKMKYITFINLTSRLFFFVFVFIAIKDKNDYLMWPIINGIGCLIAGLISLYVVFYQHGISFRWQKKETLIHYINDSKFLFFGNIAGKAKLISNRMFIGIFIGMSSVAIYDIVDKLKDVSMVFLQLIVDVMFPKFAKHKDPKLVKKTIRLLVALSVFCYLFIGLSLYFIVPIYFKNYIEVVSIFWVLGLMIIFQPMNYLFGIGVLIVNGLIKQYSINLYLSASVYLLSILAVYLLASIDIYTLSFCLVFSAFIAVLNNIVVAKKHKLTNWIY